MADSVDEGRDVVGQRAEVVVAQLRKEVRIQRRRQQQVRVL